MTTRSVTLDPHHPRCRFPKGTGYAGGWDPQRCCYCAALVRQDYALSGLNVGLTDAGASSDPLEYRYGGPLCSCDR